MSNEMKEKDMTVVYGNSNEKVNKALMNIDDICAYLGIGKTKARELLHDYKNGFTVRIGNRLYAHRRMLDRWIDSQVI